MTDSRDDPRRGHTTTAAPRELLIRRASRGRFGLGSLPTEVAPRVAQRAGWVALAAGALFAHAKEDPESPSTYVELPVRFEELIMRCLSKDPADRPASALELAELFTLSVDTPWTNEDARRWWLLHDPAPMLPTTLRGNIKSPRVEHAAGDRARARR